MKKLTYIFLSLLLLAGCTGTSRQPQLVAMDSLLLSRPDSALTLLRGMSFTDKADRMYHYLLLADACNKCYDTLPSDTILQEVTDYYDRHGTPNEQVRAHYLLGCAYRDMGEAPMALQCYQQAIECADTISEDCNYAILCRIHAQAAGLFKEQYMPDEAIYELDEAMKCSQMANDSLTAMYCYENKLGALYQAGEYDSVLVNTKIVYNRYRDMGLTNRAACSLSPAIFVLIQRRELQKAKEYINIYQRYTEREDNKKNQQGMYYTYLGFYYLYSNQLDSAIYYFNQQLDYKERLNNRVLAYHGLFDTYQKANQKDSAMKYAKLYNEANDSSNIFESAERLQRMQAMYRYQRYQQIAEHEARVAEKAKVRGVAIFFVCLLIISIGILSYQKYKRKKQTEIQQLNDSYIHALLKYNNLSVEHERLRQEDNQLINDKQLEVEELRTVINNYQSKLQRDNIGSQLAAFKECKIVSYFRSKTKITIRTTPPAESDWIQLIKQFSQDVPSAFIALGTDTVLTPNELRLCVLMLIGFKNADITILFNSSVQSISNIKARANYKLFGDNSASGLEKNLMRIAGMV